MADMRGSTTDSTGKMKLDPHDHHNDELDLWNGQTSSTNFRTRSLETGFTIHRARMHNDFIASHSQLSNLSEQRAGDKHEQFPPIISYPLLEYNK